MGTWFNTTQRVTTPGRSFPAQSSTPCSICGGSVLGEHLQGPLQGQKLVNLMMLRGVDLFKIE